MQRLTTAQRDALTPTAGMTIFNSTANKFQGYIAGNTVEVLDQSSTGTGGGFNLGFFGQDFKANATGSLSKIVLNIQGFGSTANFTLKIKAGPANSTNSPLHTQVITINATGEMAFVISGNVPVTQGNTYSFWFEPVGSSSAAIHGSAQNSYTQGALYLWADNSYFISGYDMYFKTYVSNPGDQPATWVNLH